MSISFTLAEASKILRIELPTTANALKSAFRRRSREVHPDHSVAVDAKEQFQILSAAYEFAQTRPDWLLAVDGATPGEALACDDGTPLSECGNGLGPTTNGRPCTDCGGKGFTSYTAETIPCPDCRRGGVLGVFIEYRCRRCGGDGTFKKNGRAAGKCFGCQGSGWIQEKRRNSAPDYFRFGFFGGSRIVNHCTTCKGRFEIKNPRGWLVYVKCHHCKGMGEILIFNPVIPKGLLAQRK